MIRKILVVALIVAASAALGQDTGVKPIVTREIASTAVTAAGQPIRLPSGSVRVIVTQYDIAPGATLPVHKHLFPRYAYVEQGHLTVTEVDSGASHDYAQGDVIVEMVDRWHFGRNTGQDPVRLLVFDQVPDGASNTILRQL
jgi:quercetin dioxygenase-like cupin family protein